jgi:hypothetical protein
MNKNSGITNILQYKDKKYKLKYDRYSYCLGFVFVDTDNNERISILEKRRIPVSTFYFNSVVITADNHIIYILTEPDSYPNWRYFIKFGEVEINEDKAFIKEKHSADITDFYKKCYYDRHDNVRPGTNTFAAYNADVKSFCMLVSVLNIKSDNNDVTSEYPILFWKMSDPSNPIIDNYFSRRINKLPLKSPPSFDENSLQILNEDQISVVAATWSREEGSRIWNLTYDLNLKIFTSVNQTTS